MTAGPGPAGAVAGAVADAFRDEWGQVVATLIGATGDWDLAEECAQEAFAAALARWRRDGVPRRPGAWLTTVARNRMRDRLRRTATEHRKLAEIAMTTDPEGPDALDDVDAIPDDRLREVVPGLVELEVAVPHLSPAVR